jgi:hypothetical protein
MHGNATSPLDHRVRDYLVPGQRAKRLLIRNAGPYADPARNHSQRTARQQAGGQSPSDPGRRFPYGQGPQHVPAFPDARIYLRGFPHQLQPDGVAGARVLARTLTVLFAIRRTDALERTIRSSGRCRGSKGPSAVR